LAYFNGIGNHCLKIEIFRGAGTVAIAAHGVRIFFALIAVALPVLMALNFVPSVTFLNQAAALAGWGALTWVLSVQPLVFQLKGRIPGLRVVLLALGLMVVSVLWAWLGLGLPAGLAWSSIGLLGAAALVLGVSAQAQRMGCGDGAYRAFCWAMLIAGMLSLAIALVQYFVPSLADGVWIAHSSFGGRVGGNLRQPNHLSSLLLWSVVALAWLHDTHIERALRPKYVARAVSVLLLFGFLLGVVLTVSRTGSVCVLMLALWALCDRSLSRFMRGALLGAPLLYLVGWWSAEQWAQMGVHAFSGADQLNKADLSSSRFAIWQNTLALLAKHPWTGVGWGEFNFAWTLTPFPGRPTAFFDHTHNLPLQLLVEMGIPLGGLVLGALAWGLVRSVMACFKVLSSERPMVRSALVMVLMMCVHSMLEYPLWYAYFLLPTAFAFGVCLGGGALPAGVGTVEHRNRSLVLPWACMVLVLSACISVFDYQRVVAVFSTPVDGLSLSQRIANGQRSWFFAHHADYAAATTAVSPSEAIRAFTRAPHYLLDTRLMMAWATALNEHGEVDKARYVAQRLAEFRNTQSVDFFAPCIDLGIHNVPFQCQEPLKAWTFEDFR
jgi:O-antigen ligase